MSDAAAAELAEVVAILLMMGVGIVAVCIALARIIGILREIKERM